jgi:hypothetical protein
MLNPNSASFEPTQVQSCPDFDYGMGCEMGNSCMYFHNLENQSGQEYEHYCTFESEGSENSYFSTETSLHPSNASSSMSEHALEFQPALPCEGIPSSSTPVQSTATQKSCVR